MSKTFKAKAPDDFRDKMIGFWIVSESLTRDEALSFYDGDRFKTLCERVSGSESTFEYDLGYADESQDYKYCFEIDDMDFVIPVDILEGKE